MWKAIVWGLIGLLLGVVLGGAWGAIVGTLIGSVAGALPAVSAWRARRCVTRCRGCPVMCEPKAAAPLAVKVAVAAPVAAVVAVHVLAPAAALLPLLTCAILVMCAMGCVVLVLLLRYGRSMRPVKREAIKHTVIPARRALPAPPRAIGPPPVVIGEVVSSREEVWAHALPKEFRKP